mgnify:CR=1 FL=1
MLRIFILLFLVNFSKCFLLKRNILKRKKLYMSNNIILKFGGSSLKSEFHIKNVNHYNYVCLLSPIFFLIGTLTV